MREISQIATALQHDALVTLSTTRPELLDVEQYIDLIYTDMMRTAAKKNKKHAALNGLLPPTGVYFVSGAIAECLGKGGGD